MSDSKAWDLWDRSNIDGSVMGNCGAGSIPVRQTTTTGTGDNINWPTVGTPVADPWPNYEPWRQPIYPGVPGHHEFQPYDTWTSNKIIVGYHPQHLGWKEESAAFGSIFAIDLPGVSADTLHVEIRDERYIVVNYTRVDDKNHTEQSTQFDLKGKDIDVSSAKASFKHCVLRVQFNLGSTVPNGRKLDVET